MSDRESGRMTPHRLIEKWSSSSKSENFVFYGHTGRQSRYYFIDNHCNPKKNLHVKIQNKTPEREARKRGLHVIRYSIIRYKI